MKYRSDYVTNSSSTSYIINVSLICNDETLEKKQLELYKKEEDDYLISKFFCGENYVESDATLSDDENIIRKIEEYEVIEAIISLATSNEKYEDEDECIIEEAKKKIDKYIKKRKLSIFDFTDIVISKAISADGGDYSNTGIYDIFNNVTLEEIDKDIESVAEKFNTDVESLKVYKDHLNKNLSYHTVEEIQIKSIYTNKINKNIKVRNGLENE